MQRSTENLQPSLASSNIPSSPVKEPASSPNFRPAGEQNLTQDLKKVSQSQGTGRKSIGRRVSFAATAHVRLYEKGDSDRDDEESEELEDMDFRPLSRKSLPMGKGSPLPPPAAMNSPLRPSRLHESISFTPADEDMSMPSTPSAHSGRGSLKPGESPSLMHVDTRAMFAEPSQQQASQQPRFSTVTNYSEGEASFDVELKDAHSSSFTSYHSAGEEDGTMELGAHLQPRTDDTDMDFTNCVGGILAKVDGQGQRASVGGPNVGSLVAADGNDTMDFTVCVGGLIRRLPTVRLSDVSQASSVDTMELTECVGQILSRQNQSQQAPPAHENTAMETDMEMTTVLPRTIHGASRSAAGSTERLESPSPFLEATPRKEPVASGITFIGDVGMPDAFDLLETMSPMTIGEESAGTGKSAQERLFDALIDTAKCSEEPTPSKSTAYGLLPSTALQASSLHGSLSVMATPRRPMLSSLAASYSMQPSGMPSPSPFLVNSTDVTASPAKMAAASSPSVALSDFLNDTGIRFLENISSLKRRETTGRPRDSDIVAPSRQAFVAAALVPQLNFYEQAAEDLVPAIVETREMLAQQENQFAVQPPLALLQWQRAGGDAAARQLLLARLKTLKSVARLMAKQQWHAWRLPRQMALVAALEEAAGRAGAAWDPLQRADRQLDTRLAELEPKERALRAELNSLHHARAFPNAAEQARQLEAAVAAQAQAIAAADAELAELERQEAELRAAASAATAQKEALAQRIEATRAALAATPRATELALSEMRSLLALRKAVTGWEFVHVGPSSLLVRYLVGGPVTIRLDFDAESRMVTGLQLLPGNNCKLAVLRHAARLAPLIGMPLAECLAECLGRLDAVAQLERSLAAMDSACSLTIPEPEDDQSQVTLVLGFFSYEARSKFDITLLVDASGPALRLLPATFTHHYGPIEQADVHDYVGMALSNPAIERAPAACKQIVTSVMGLMAEHTVDGRPSDAFSLCMHSASDHQMQLD